MSTSKSGGSLLLLLFTFSSFALPKKFEIWFLSPDQIAQILERQEKTPLYKKTALSTQCQRMGDYCFDPQLGLYRPGTDPYANAPTSENVPSDYRAVESKEKYNFMPEANSVGRNMVTCDDGGFFDIYCGKAKTFDPSPVSLEIWIDISSTMKQVDNSPHNQAGCNRSAFVRQLDAKCPLREKMDVYIFTETLRKVDMIDRVCTNHGLNKADRLVKQIKEAQVDNLIIITDIFEGQEGVIQNFLRGEARGHGSAKGLDEKLFARQITDLVPSVVKMCAGPRKAPGK